MPSFPDVNVWLALAAADHGHHAQAVHWLDTCRDPVIAFCRVTQAGLLRLLTNRGVMGGYPLTADGAWKVADTFLADSRITLLAEPLDIEERWRLATHKRAAGSSFWTDAYLAAFAVSAGATLVTFDRGFTRYADLRLKLLR